MDELTALERFRSDLPDPEPGALEAIRARLPDASVPDLSSTPRHGGAVRTAGKVAAVVAVAAATVAGAVVLVGSGAPGRPAAGPGSTSVKGTSGSPDTRFVSAAQVLDVASAAALRTPRLEPGQYRYESEHGFTPSDIGTPPEHGANEFVEYRTQTWTPYSSAGTRYLRTDDAISVRFPSARQRAYAERTPRLIPKHRTTYFEARGLRRWREVYPKPGPGNILSDLIGTKGPVWEAPTKAKVAALPLDPAALRRSAYRYARRAHTGLVRYGKGDQFSVTDLATDGVTLLLESDVVPNDLRAALYQVAKTLPGVRLIPSLANYDGTHGVAIGFGDGTGIEHELIFSRTDGSFIGERWIATRTTSSDYHVTAGTVLLYTARRTGVRGRPSFPHRPAR